MIKYIRSGDDTMLRMKDILDEKDKRLRLISEEVTFPMSKEDLKNIDLTLPRNKLIVFTGLSGSGKSTLAFDTIFAEGQRRYVESLSSYARQFLGLMEKPEVLAVLQFCVLDY